MSNIARHKHPTHVWLIEQRKREFQIVVRETTDNGFMPGSAPVVAAYVLLANARRALAQFKMRVK
jgi:hypothetical protein